MKPIQRVKLPAALGDWRIWTHLGWRDLRAQYARTWIGPWWTTATLGAVVLGTSMAVAFIGGEGIKEIVLRITIGLSIWTFFATSLVDGASIFETERSLLLNTTISELALVWRVVWRNLIIFLHNLALVALCLLAFSTDRFLALPWLLITILVSLPFVALVTLVFGILALLRRDFRSLLPAVVQVGFFVTPVIWSPAPDGWGHVLTLINPIAWSIELARNVILDGVYQWVLLLQMVIASAACLLILSQVSHRMSFVRKRL